MLQAPASIVRITYEAFSRFSNQLHSCRTFEDVEKCFTLHLKYFFNCHVFRASYSCKKVFVTLTSHNRTTRICVSDAAQYLPYEEEQLHSLVPIRKRQPDAALLPDAFVTDTALHPELWVWHFTRANNSLIISVLSSDAKRFSEKDITFLKLVSESLESKLLELCLIRELDEKNAVITNINLHQQEIIKSRTQEIEEKNATLLDISILNAHSVREPLSRILGLLNLLDDEDAATMLQSIAAMLKQSANDLDNALQNVIDHATKDLIELKA